MASEEFNLDYKFEAIRKVSGWQSGWQETALSRACFLPQHPSAWRKQHRWSPWFYHFPFRNGCDVWVIESAYSSTSVQLACCNTVFLIVFQIKAVAQNRLQTTTHDKAGTFCIVQTFTHLQGKEQWQSSEKTAVNLWSQSHLSRFKPGTATWRTELVPRLSLSWRDQRGPWGTMSH